MRQLSLGFKGVDLLVHHPSVWLLVSTALLLLGQAVAPFISRLFPAAGFFLLAPLFLCFRAKTRRCGFVLLLGAVAFGVGFFRHRQLIEPAFPPHHLHALTNRAEPLYIEGFLLHEPEKLPNRSRWIVRAERIWHPTGAEEITGRAPRNR